MTPVGVSSSNGAVLPAVSTILPVVSISSVNEVLTSTLGVQGTEVSTIADLPRSVVKPATVVGSVNKSSDGADDDDNNDENSDTHGDGTDVPTEQKG